MEKGTVRSNERDCDVILNSFFKGEFNPVYPLRSGVIEWVTQGLTKVLPQPDEKYKETKEEVDEHTEVKHKHFHPVNLAIVLH